MKDIPAQAYIQPSYKCQPLIHNHKFLQVELNARYSFADDTPVAVSFSDTCQLSRRAVNKIIAKACANKIPQLHTLELAKAC